MNFGKSEAELKTIMQEVMQMQERCMERIIAISYSELLSEKLGERGSLSGSEQYSYCLTYYYEAPYRYHTFSPQIERTPVFGDYDMLMSTYLVFFLSN